MSLTISQFVNPKMLTPAQLAHIRNQGERSQALRLTVCRACGSPIDVGAWRLAGHVGYVGSQTVYIHETCNAKKGRNQ
jgi:hypothetical protein